MLSISKVKLSVCASVDRLISEMLFWTSPHFWTALQGIITFLRGLQIEQDFHYHNTQFITLTNKKTFIKTENYLSNDIYLKKSPDFGSIKKHVPMCFANSSFKILNSILVTNYICKNEQFFFQDSISFSLHNNNYKTKMKWTQVQKK